jgi:ADP-ribosylglycohydrolase
MAALAILNVEGSNFEQAVSSAVGFGRGCGPIAAIVGSVCGTLMGASAIPEGTVGKLLTSNDRLELTKEVDVFTAILFNMVKRDRDKASAWIEALDALYPLE